MICKKYHEFSTLSRRQIYRSIDSQDIRLKIDKKTYS